MLSVVSWQASCASVDTYCLRTFIIEPTEHDVAVVSNQLARQVVTHNNRRQAVCK